MWDVDGWQEAAARAVVTHPSPLSVETTATAAAAIQSHAPRIIQAGLDYPSRSDSFSTALTNTQESNMNARVTEELGLIPRGSLPQNLYRSAFVQARQNALVRRPEVGPHSADAHALLRQGFVRCTWTSRRPPGGGVMAMDEKVPVFISFDYDNEDDLKTLLVGQAANEDSPFSIADWSIKEESGDWTDKARTRIKRVDQVIVICGKSTDMATASTPKSRSPGRRRRRSHTSSLPAGLTPQARKRRRLSPPTRYTTGRGTTSRNSSAEPGELTGWI